MPPGESLPARGGSRMRAGSLPEVMWMGEPFVCGERVTGTSRAEVRNEPRYPG